MKMELFLMVVRLVKIYRDSRNLVPVSSCVESNGDSTPNIQPIAIIPP